MRDNVVHTRARAAALLLAALLAACGSAGLAAFPALAEGSLTASTEVGVVTLDGPTALRIEGASEDVAGDEDEVRALVLEVVAAGGQGELSCAWTRTENGSSDPMFSQAGFSCPLADVRAGSAYVYTATVSDEAGASASVDVAVRVSAAPGEYVYERVTFPLLGVTVEANRHADARFVVSAHPAGTDVFARLLEAAGGSRLRPPAYAVRVEGQPEGAPAFVGPVRVSVPSLGAPAIARAWAADDEGDAVDVLLVDEAGLARRVPGTEAGGRVAFETGSLGDFAVVSDGSGPVAPGHWAAEAGSATARRGVLGPTGDSALRGAAALAACACCTGAALLLARVRKGR